MYDIFIYICVYDIFFIFHECGHCRVVCGGGVLLQCYSISAIFSCCMEYIQWNPSKVDNLEPHILSIIVGCPLWRGCIDVNGKQSGPRNLSVILRCLL